MKPIQLFRQNNLQDGDPVLCSILPSTGKVLQWRGPSERTKVILDRTGTVVDRDPRCLFRRGVVEEKVTQFQVANYLLCKVRRCQILGNIAFPGNGWLYIARWFRTYTVDPRSSHVSPVDAAEIYCITMNGRILHRPRIVAEIAAVASDTVGDVELGLLPEF